MYIPAAVQFDEVKWVTVKDIDRNDLDVMHVNGPTVTVQPGFGYESDYGTFPTLSNRRRSCGGALRTAVRRMTLRTV